MSNAIDILTLVLFGSAVVAFVLGVHALGAERDLHALYWLVVGGLCLRSATQLSRPKSGSR